MYFRLHIFLIKGLSKHTLHRYFQGINIDPKYTFFHAVFFSLFLSIPFQNMSTWLKNIPPPILNVFAPLNDVCVYCLGLTLITLFFKRMMPDFKYKCPPHNQFMELRKKYKHHMAAINERMITLTPSILNWQPYLFIIPPYTACRHQFLWHFQFCYLMINFKAAN